ncbi:MAG: hypothetical protein HQK53_15255 [Oligoflexia bacterium]|nr:hypothetical protein [Oligoflexia bacterium]
MFFSLMLLVFSSTSIFASITSFDCKTNNRYSGKGADYLIKVFETDGVVTSVVADIKYTSADANIEHRTDGLYQELDGRGLGKISINFITVRPEIDWKHEPYCWKIGKMTKYITLYSSSGSAYTKYGGQLNFSPNIYTNPEVPDCRTPIYDPHPSYSRYDIVCTRTIEN